jgi:hypothetical protein
VKWTARESLPPLSFSKALRRQQQPVRFNHSVARLRRIALAFDEQSRSNNAVMVLCCHRCVAEFVQLNGENRNTDFVPGFSIMHGCIESRATR